VRRLIRLGAQSRRIVDANVEGPQPPDSTVISITRRIDLALLWSARRNGSSASDSSDATGHRRNIELGLSMIELAGAVI